MNTLNLTTTTALPHSARAPSEAAVDAAARTEVRAPGLAQTGTTGRKKPGKVPYAGKEPRKVPNRLPVPTERAPRGLTLSKGRPKKARKAANGSAGKAKAVKMRKPGEGIPKGSKIELIAKLFRRKNGTTTRDILDATGWKAVNVPRQAKLAGIKIKKAKGDDGVTHYVAID
jgi:hypothetical protein